MTPNQITAINCAYLAEMHDSQRDFLEDLIKLEGSRDGPIYVVATGEPVIDVYRELQVDVTAAANRYRRYAELLSPTRGKA